MGTLQTINPATLIAVSLAFSVIPIFLGVCTSYLKVSIVFGLIKNALGTQNTPGPLIVVALSIALSYYIMAPIGAAIVDKFPPPSTKGGYDISLETLQKFDEAFSPLKDFLTAQSGDEERELFVSLRKELVTKSEESSQKTFQVLIPAFMISQLKASFRMGFILLIPFLVVDLVVANILAGLGMYMMSPTTISLPIKLILFVASDAWILIVKSLVASYGV